MQLLKGITDAALQKMTKAQTWSEVGTLAGESQFKLFLDTLRLLGVPHVVHHAPCQGNDAIGKDARLQQAMLDFGHDVTSHCTTGVQIGDEMLVFFTGAGDTKPADRGAFIFRFNVKTREVVHNTVERRIKVRR